MRVLIVEDDKDIADLLQYNLKLAGFDAYVVHDGAPALLELRKDHYDLVILDLMLPKISGLEVCKAVRQDSALQLLPILVVTANGKEEARTQALSLGANDFLAKPFSPCVLVDRVRSLMQQPTSQGLAC